MRQLVDLLKVTDVSKITDELVEAQGDCSDRMGNQQPPKKVSWV